MHVAHSSTFDIAHSSGLNPLDLRSCGSANYACQRQASRVILPNPTRPARSHLCPQTHRSEILKCTALFSWALTRHSKLPCAAPVWGERRDSDLTSKQKNGKTTSQKDQHDKSRKAQEKFSSKDCTAKSIPNRKNAVAAQSLQTEKIAFEIPLFGDLQSHTDLDKKTIYLTVSIPKAESPKKKSVPGVLTTQMTPHFCVYKELLPPLS